MPVMAGPAVGNRPPSAPLPVLLSIRHWNESSWGTGVLVYRVGRAARRRSPRRWQHVYIGQPRV